MGDLDEAPTPKDLLVLNALAGEAGPVTSGVLARLCNIRTTSPRETAARHAIRLVKLGLAIKSGTRTFPTWSISGPGKALAEKLEREIKGHQKMEDHD